MGLSFTFQCLFVLAHDKNDLCKAVYRDAHSFGYVGGLGAPWAVYCHFKTSNGCRLQCNKPMIRKTGDLGLLRLIEIR